MNRQQKQLILLPKMKDVFVGPRRGTNSKSHRPLESKKPLHICMRSRFAKGKRTLLGVNRPRVDNHVRTISRRFGIKVVMYTNVGNHLHLVVKLPGSAMTARRQYAKWIRLLSSRISFDIGGGKKGDPFKDETGKRAKFWDSLPFSRVIHGRQGWKAIDRYILKNELESQGLTKEIASLVAQELYDSSRIERLAAFHDTA